jgi:hypothetical protein
MVIEAEAWWPIGSISVPPVAVTKASILARSPVLRTTPEEWLT